MWLKQTQHFGRIWACFELEVSKVLRDMVIIKHLILAVDLVQVSGHATSGSILLKFVCITCLGRASTHGLKYQVLLQP